MKRSIALICVITIVAAMFSGCHGAVDREAFAIPDEFDTSRTYEITFWAKNENNTAQQLAYQKAIEDFEAIYPNIKIKLRPYTNYADIYNDVITNIATDTTPNVCITYPDHIATYLTGENTVVPLDALLTHERYGLGGSEVRFDAPTKDEIYPKFLNECFLNGYYYALPYMRSTEAVYINKDYVEKLGYTVPDVLTWDYIWEVSNAALAKDANGKYILNGKSLMLPFCYKSTDNMMIQMVQQLGSGYAAASGEIQLFNETTKELLHNIARQADAGSFTTFGISGYPSNMLNRGTCVFGIDSTAGATWAGNDAPQNDIPKDDQIDFEVAVRPIPQFDPEHPQMISQGPSMCIFNKQDPQEVLASWLFMQYMLTDDVQITYSQTEGYIPVTSKAQQTQRYQDYLNNAGIDNDLHYQVKLDATKILLENIDNTFVTPVFNGSASLRDAAGHMIESVCKSILRMETVDEAYMDRLYTNTKALYRLDQIEIYNGHRLQLGPLPTSSVILLSSIVLAWVLIGIYAVSQRKKRK